MSTIRNVMLTVGLVVVGVLLLPLAVLLIIGEGVGRAFEWCCESQRDGRDSK